MSYSYIYISGPSGRTPSQDSSNLKGQIFDRAYSTREKLKATQCTFRDDVEARDGISFEQVTADRVSSSMGKVIAVSSTLGKVDARDEIELSDSQAKSLKTSMSKVSWINSQAPETTATTSITARDGIKLEFVKCSGEVSCSMGEIEAKNCGLQSVSGREHIKFIATAADDVKSSMGKIKALDSTMSHISARDGVKLNNTSAKNVKCSMGKIEAENCTLLDLEARDGIMIRDTIARDISCSMGEVTVFLGEAKEHCYSSVTARDKITLTHVAVSGKVVCSMGGIEATYCRLNEVEAVQELSLTHTFSQTVKLKASSEKTAVIYLPESRIEGDLIIDIQNEFTSGIMMDAGDGVKVTGRTSGTSVIQIGKSFIVTVPGLEHLRNICVKEGSTGTVNESPYKYENGRFIPIAAEKKEKSSEVQVEIRGGIIKGRVIFQNGAGKYVLLDGAKVLT